MSLRTCLQAICMQTLVQVAFGMPHRIAENTSIPTYTINVQRNTTHAMSPLLYGIFFEEVCARLQETFMSIPDGDPTMEISLNSSSSLALSSNHWTFRLIMLAMVACTRRWSEILVIIQQVMASAIQCCMRMSGMQSYLSQRNYGSTTSTGQWPS